MSLFFQCCSLKMSTIRIPQYNSSLGVISSLLSVHLVLLAIFSQCLNIFLLFSSVPLSLYSVTLLSMATMSPVPLILSHGIASSLKNSHCLIRKLSTLERDTNQLFQSIQYRIEYISMTSILFFIIINKSIVEQFCETTFIFIYSVSYFLLCIIWEKWL